MLTIHNGRHFRTRAEANTAAAALLRKFITETGLSTRRFAEAARVAVTTLRFFLNNANPTNVRNPTRCHGRGPYLNTLKPLLDLQLPEELREALMESIYFEDRTAARLSASAATSSAAGRQSEQTSPKDDATL